jgi:hypothetical protein
LVSRRQVVQVCAEHKKPRKLEKHLAEIHASAPARNPPRILIFANRIKTVRYVHRLLSDAKLRVAMLHGERSQAEREVRPLLMRIPYCIAALLRPHSAPILLSMRTFDEHSRRFCAPKRKLPSHKRNALNTKMC